MQTSQLFKYSFLFLLSLSVNANDHYISFDQKFMDADWSFLPEVPASFDYSKSKNIEFGFNYKKLSTNFFKNDMDLSLERQSYPKSISLEATKKGMSLGYKINNNDVIYVTSSSQNSVPQNFSCYEFSGFILGSCDDATITISSSNEKYDELGTDIISINGDTRNLGLGYRKYFDNFWIKSMNIEIVNTEYDYNWITPIEDIKSPFLLNLTINGNVLGDAINTTFSRLPQRDKWSSQQIKFGLKQNFFSIYNFNLISEYDLVLISFNDYTKFRYTPKSNFKIRTGIEFDYKNTSILFYGDLYKNNLIGFEPITFNQRTEDYFDKAYGEIGAILSINF